MAHARCLEADPEFDTSRSHETPMTAFRAEGFKYVEGSEKAELFGLPDEETLAIGGRSGVRARFEPSRRRYGSAFETQWYAR